MKISEHQNHPEALSLRLPGKIKAYTLLLLLSFLFCLCGFAQENILVKGRITNEKNEPVVGASVMVKGTNTGTTTDEAGEFQISAPSNGVLVVTSVGYPAKEISVDNQSSRNISLAATSTDLESVVVVGYGTQRKKDVTGAVVNVNEKIAA